MNYKTTPELDIYVNTPDSYGCQYSELCYYAAGHAISRITPLVEMDLLGLKDPDKESFTILVVYSTDSSKAVVLVLVLLFVALWFILRGDLF